jgi:mono/diheme cytochrome c family protein
MRTLTGILFAAVLALGVGARGAGAAEDAAKTFRAKCANCHGEDGKGQTTMGKKLSIKDWTDAKAMKGLTDEKITSTIKDGVKGDDGKDKMKPFAGKLTDDQIGALVAYVKTFMKS